MFVTYVLKKISNTYRTFLFVLMTSLIVMSFTRGDKKHNHTDTKEVTTEQTKKEHSKKNTASIQKAIDHAVVPAINIDIEKVAILFREILLDETSYFHLPTDTKIIRPKLLQTLLTTAIQKNAP
jgi:hypothetical protein